MSWPAKNKIFLTGFALGLLLAGALFFGGTMVKAATTYSIEDIGSSIGLGTVDLKSAVINIIKWVLGIITLVAVSFLIYGGVLWMTAKGNEEKIAKAKKVIINAVIGLIIILLAWAIVIFVSRTFTNVTTGGRCTEGERRDISPGDQCLICSEAGAWYLDISREECTSVAGLLNFRVNEFATANENGIVNEDLYTCSAISSIFNNRVYKETITPVENTDLKLEELTCSISGATCLIDANCGPGGGTCEATLVEGNWPTASKSVTYKHKKVCTNDPAQECTADTDCEGENTCEIVLFNTDTHYRLTLPKSITDLNGLALSQANFIFCDDTDPANITCTFTTGDQNDTVAPYVTTTYPVHDGNAGYPDQNVSRQPIIDINFSESIDATTVVDVNNSPQPHPTNVILEQINGQGGAVVAAVNPATLMVEEDAYGFKLSLVPPAALESFTWYRLTVQNVEDLCGNAMEPMPTLEFQTNDKIAGFRSWYPKGDNECPDVKIAATFNTSMYYQWVQFELSDETAGTSQTIELAPPDITRESSISNVLGTLQIMNADFDEPSTNFTRYELRPANPLIPDHNYQVFVRTNRVIDSAGTLLAKDWTFSVATAEDCSCAPQIEELDPEQGGWGECVTIKGYCFTGTSNHAAVPDRILFGTAQPNIESYASNYIVTTSPTGFNGPYPQTAPVTVRIDYDEPTYGQIESDPFDYIYTSNTQATGPCLFSESHSSCYPGSAVTLRGIRFKDNPPTRIVTFDDGDGNLNGPINSWADTTIKTNVPATTEENNHDGDLTVTNDVGTSNPLYFDICQPPPGVPIIKNYSPTCSTACINTLPFAEFNNVEMNAGTFTPVSVTLQRCTDDACDTFDQNINTTPVYSYDNGAGEGLLEINYAGFLTPNRYYRVILDGAVIQSLEGVAIGNLNYDSDTKFSWIFGTKNDSTACAINETRVRPLTEEIKIGRSANFYASAYASPNECSAAGEKLRATDYNWDWISSAPAIATISTNDLDGDGRVDPVQIASANPTTAGVTQITPRETASGISATTPATLTVVDDPTACFDDSECAVNELGQTCPGSVCLNNHCTPVFLAPPDEFAPDNGPVGTWVTISGCWFGNYVEGKSKVFFNNNREGKIPDETLCGKSWLNYQIIREVPEDETADLTDDAITGRIRVEGGNSSTYTYTPITTVDSFVVDASTKGPQICALEPIRGKMGTSVTVKGEGFDTPRGQNWKVTFHDGADVLEADYGTWVEKNIEVKVPSTAVSGPVRVDKNGTLSNPAGFRVLPPTCTPCENDPDCAAPNLGCGYDGCCYERPRIESSVPEDGQTDVCLNSKVEIRFNEKMDKSTLNTSTISLWMDPPSGAAGGVSLVDKLTVRDKSVTLNLGLLSRNTEYVVSVSAAVRNSFGVTMNANRQIRFFTADVEAACQISLLTLEPASYTFTQKDQTQNFQVHAFDSTGHELESIPDVYSWDWNWSSADETVVSITNTGSDLETATAEKNGSTKIKAEAQATAGWDGTKSVSASVRVIFCDMPWEPPEGYEDESGNCEVAGADCLDYNFHLFYCRGSYGICEINTTQKCSSSFAAACPAGETCCPNPGELCQYTSGTLPDFNLKVERGWSGNVGDALKQYLFKESDRCEGTDVTCTTDADCAAYGLPVSKCEGKKDGIGIRIYANPGHLSPRTWYEANIENRGSPSSTEVDGYEAIRDGRTVYVAAANVVSGTVYNNIYLISYNDNAEQNTVKIFNQMLKNWRFNTNEADISAEDKVLLTRDIKRLADLRTISSYLEAYRLKRSATAGENLVQNPGFEANASGSPANWSTASSPGTEEVVTAEKLAGNNSLRLAVSNNVAYAYQEFNLEFGKTYEVSGTVKTNLNANDSAIMLGQCIVASTGGNLYNELGCGLGFDSETVRGDKNWTKVSAIVTPLKPDRRLRLVLHMNTRASTGFGEVWWDEINVKQIEAPYPALEAGSYLKNISTSRWPSWQAALGNALGKSLPSDPLNEFASCPANLYSDVGACWDEPTKKFFCDPASHIYAYKSNGVQYELYSHLEYSGWGAMTGSTYNICTAPSICGCFNYCFNCRP